MTMYYKRKTSSRACMYVCTFYLLRVVVRKFAFSGGSCSILCSTARALRHAHTSCHTVARSSSVA